MICSNWSYLFECLQIVCIIFESIDKLKKNEELLALLYQNLSIFTKRKRFDPSGH